MTYGASINEVYRQAGLYAGVALHPHAILAPSSPVTAFALKQTSTVSVIFVNVVDPIRQGFVANLSRPGANATVLINFESAIASKWIDLLKELC